MHAVAKHRFLDHPDAQAGVPGSQEPVGVLPLEGGVKRPDPLERAAAKEPGSLLREHVPRPALFEREPRGALRARLEQQLEWRGHHVRLGVLRQIPGLRGELGRKPYVVAPVEGDQLAPGGRDARVQRRGHAARLLAQIGHGPGPGHVGSAVGGAVVHDDHLERVVVLGQDAVDRLAEVVLAIAHGNHHAHQLGAGESRRTALAADRRLQHACPLGPALVRSARS